MGLSISGVQIESFLEFCFGPVPVPFVVELDQADGMREPLPDDRPMTMLSRQLFWLLGNLPLVERIPGSRKRGSSRCQPSLTNYLGCQPESCLFCSIRAFANVPSVLLRQMYDDDRVPAYEGDR